MSTDPSDSDDLRSDLRLPQLDVAWSDERMLELLGSSVLPELVPGSALASVEKTRTRYEPGERCVLLYDLTYREPADGLPTSATVTFAASDHPDELVAAADDTAAVFLPAHGCLVELYPSDRGLPALRAALDPSRMLPHLPQLAGDGPLHVEILRYLPHMRCVLRYESAQGTVIGKLYPDREQAERAVFLLEALRPQALDQGLSMPAHLGWVPEWNLVLMEHIDSKPWEKRALKLKTSEADALAAVSAAAAALATFHGLQVALDVPQRCLSTEIETARRRATAMSAIAPALGRHVDAVITELAAREAQRSPGPRCLSHGDFAPSQLLLLGDGLALIDVDMACHADPALDVGNFMAKLHRKAVSKGAPRHRVLAEHFLAESSRLHPEHDLDARAGLFCANRLVRMAVDVFCRSPWTRSRAGLQSLPHQLVDEAAALLAALD